MKIAFLLGSPEISGGSNVIFEHATKLQRDGNVVTILTELPVLHTSYAWHTGAASLTWRTIDEGAVLEFDFVIATWWQSVQYLEKIHARFYVYFVQSIESRFFPAKDIETFEYRDIDVMVEWCENTYRYPLPIITEAHWIQRYLSSKMNLTTHLVPNGIRKDFFSESGPVVAKRNPGRLRVLVEGPLGVFYKNVEKTIELCCRADVPEIWLLTSSDIDQYPGIDRCFSRVAMDKVAEIYRSCDVLVKLSYVEGMFGPPLEMFHCGGTAIVYDVTGHDEYLRNGINGIVVGKDCENEVVEWLGRLKEDQELLNCLKQEAIKTASEWPDWEVSSYMFDQCLKAIESNNSEHSSTFLKEYNERSLIAKENAFRSRELERFAEREQNIAEGSSIRAKNYLQIYWDEGEGIGRELIAEYSSGDWQRCEIFVPVNKSPVIIRVDPTVRVGVIAIRKLVVTDVASGQTLQIYDNKSDWSRICVTGTAVLLRKSPYPVLEAFGEDSQMILPEIIWSVGEKGLLVTIEMCEMSYFQTLSTYSSLSQDKSSFLRRLFNVVKYLFKGKETL